MTTYGPSPDPYENFEESLNWRPPKVPKGATQPIQALALIDSDSRSIVLRLLKRKNHWRTTRLQRDLAWADKVLVKKGFPPKSARFFL